MTTNIIQPTKFDIVMQEIDELVSNYQDVISKLTGEDATVDTISAGGIYMVYLRSMQYSNTLFFDVSEM